MLRTIARTTDVEPGTVRAFEIGAQGAEAVGRSRIPILRAIGPGRSRGTRLTLANVGGTLYAIDDTCTHRGCWLGDGKLDGSTVQCACHGSRIRRHERCGRGRSGRGSRAQLSSQRRRRGGPGRPLAAGVLARPSGVGRALATYKEFRSRVGTSGSPRRGGWREGPPPRRTRHGLRDCGRRRGP